MWTSQILCPVLGNSHENLSHSGNLAETSHLVHLAGKTVPSWETRRNVCPVLETSREYVPSSKPGRNIHPILETSRVYLSHHGNLAGAAVPYWKPRRDSSPVQETKRNNRSITETSQDHVTSWKARKNICPSLETSHEYIPYPGNQAGISIPSWKPREYIFPIMETSQGQLSHTGNLAWIAVPSRKSREITVPFQKLRRTMSHLGKFARTFVPAWKPRKNIFPILESKQEYPSRHSRTPTSPASLLDPHSATDMAPVTIEIHSTKTSSLEFSVTWMWLRRGPHSAHSQWLGGRSSLHSLRNSETVYKVLMRSPNSQLHEARTGKLSTREGRVRQTRVHNTPTSHKYDVCISMRTARSVVLWKGKAKYGHTRGLLWCCTLRPSNKPALELPVTEAAEGSWTHLFSSTSAPETRLSNIPRFSTCLV